MDPNAKTVAVLERIARQECGFLHFNYDVAGKTIGAWYRDAWHGLDDLPKQIMDLADAEENPGF